MDFLYRLLEGCLIIWLVDHILALLGVTAPVNRIIQIVTMVLVLIWIILGAYIQPIVMHASR